MSAPRSYALWTVLVLLLLVSCTNPSTAFTLCRPTRTVRATQIATAKEPVDDDITRLQAKARLLLEKSKAKLASKGAPKPAAAATNEATHLPFFATSVKSRAGVIKSRNAETGLVTADGERMAALSEEEEWEMRSLFEVFENEIEENEDVYSLASQQLAARDVAASIFDLRKQLQTDDYKKIFNKRNPFIGEDN